MENLMNFEGKKGEGGGIVVERGGSQKEATGLKNFACSPGESRKEGGEHRQVLHFVRAQKGVL